LTPLVSSARKREEHVGERRGQICRCRKSGHHAGLDDRRRLALKYEDGDVVVLLVTSEHTFHEVLEEPLGPGQQLLIGPSGHGGQLIQTRVQTTIPVLY
jgi:hypothetical protein